MKMRRQFIAPALAIAMIFAALAALNAASAQSQQYGPLERGYRTGYSDGFQSGWTDQLKNAQADFRSKPDYQSADRAYIAAYGSLEDYRDGYQQGFEAGYDAGYKHQGFDSEIPAGGITRRGATPRETASSGNGHGVGNGRSERPSDTGESSSQPERTGTGNVGSTVASDVTLLVELQSRLTTDVSQRGDRFEATVVEPQEYAGATVAGKLLDVRHPSKTKGTALLQLDFDQIRMPGGDWQNFSAQVVEVVPTSTDTNIGNVDPEGGIHGKDTTKGDVAKVGGAAGIGAIIGGIAGGGKGAAIGAVIGGSAGTAGVMTQRGKDIRLERGQQLRIRASNRAR
jgi:hypothetical protein